MNTSSRDTGLTLIELIVTIAMVAVVATIVMPVFHDLVTTEQSQADLRSKAAIERFCHDWKQSGHLVAVDPVSAGSATDDLLTASDASGAVLSHIALTRFAIDASTCTATVSGGGGNNPGGNPGGNPGTGDPGPGTGTGGGGSTPGSPGSTPSALPAPTGVTLTAITVNGYPSVHMSWDSVTNAGTYYVSFSDDPTFATNSNNIRGVPVPWYESVGMDPSTIWYYRVRALPADGTNVESPWSSTFSIKIGI
jgi:prepilin-type N-terminal cleavage/methylation domain-containing protein